MGTVSEIRWLTTEYEKEKDEATELHLAESRRYHARRAGLGMCDDYRRSGSNEVTSGRFHSSAAVDLRGQLRVSCTVWWKCGCRYNRHYVRQLHYYSDGDQLRIAVTE